MKIPNVRLCIFFLGLAAAAATAIADPAATNPATGGTTTPAALAVTPVAAPLAVSGNVVPLQVTPEASKEITLNLSRWYTGASLINTLPNGSLDYISFDRRDDSPYSPLLGDDVTVGVPFQSGTTHLMIDLGPQQTTLKTFGFYSFSAAGSVELSYASGNFALKPSSSSWKSANIKQDFKANQAVHADVIAEARFVMITLTLTTPGEIGALEVFGTRIVKATVAPNQTDKTQTTVDDESNLIDFDYALQGFGAKVTQVDGGNAATANNILNTDLKSSFILGVHPGVATTPTPPDLAPNTSPIVPANITPSLAANNAVDLNNILVVDMGQQRTINKVALLFKAQSSGNFEFYLLDALPVRPDADATAPTDAPATAPTDAPAAPAAADFPSRPATAPAFYASHSNSVLRTLLFAQIGAADVGTPQTIDYLPTNFFQQAKPNYVQGVTAESERVSHDITKLPCRFCLIRWVPNNPNGPPLTVYKVNLIGKVPVQVFAAASHENAVIGGLSVPGISPTPTPPVGTIKLDPHVQQGGGGPPSTPPTNPGGDPTPTSNPTPTTPPPPPTNPVPTPTVSPPVSA